ncbi:trypsin-3-like [Anabrus simplex]|uniref:trypsin-3-like n=1 Tax=Anabrus simplex TaxID=316456 RepID=UPI0035A2655B
MFRCEVGGGGASCFCGKREVGVYLTCKRESPVVLTFQEDLMLLEEEEISDGKARKLSRTGIALPRSCECGIPNRSPYSDARLNGGQRVLGLEFPWLAAVYANDSLVGTGALINNRYILTSASTIANAPANSVRVTLGASNLCTTGGTTTNYGVDSIQIYPNYDSTTQSGDLALLRLSSAVNFNRYVRPICLPPYQNSRYFGNVGYVATWGGNSTEEAAAANNATASEVCLASKVPVPILNPRECFSANVSRELLTRDKGCVGGPGTQSIACPSDVGGLVQYYVPVVPTSYYVLVGLLIPGNQCGDTTGPSLFTRVAPYLLWIVRNSYSPQTPYCRAPGNPLIPFAI